MQKGIKAAWNRLKNAIRGNPAVRTAVRVKSPEEEFQEIGLSSWTRHVLIQHGVLSIEQLSRLTPSHIEAMKNLGAVSAAEVNRAIEKIRAGRSPSSRAKTLEAVAEPIAAYHSSADIVQSQPTDSRHQATTVTETGWAGKPIQELNLHRSVENALERAGIKTIQQLCHLSYKEIKALDGIGEHYASLIDWALTRRGLMLRTVPKSTPTGNTQLSQTGPSFKPQLPSTGVQPKDMEVARYGDVNRREDSASKMLLVSIDELALSTRSRNCLHRSGIRTIGQLKGLTENDLLCIRNLGVTCAREILKETSSFLERGHQVNPSADAVDVPSSLSSGVAETAVLGESVAVLALSTRPAGVLDRARIQTVGDLCAFTAEQLLELDNFGATSLSEVVEALERLGLTLRGGDKSAHDAPQEAEDLASQPVSVLKLTTRSMGVFDRYGVRTIGDLCGMTASDLLGLENFGKGSLHEVVTALKRRGLNLRAEMREPKGLTDEPGEFVEPKSLTAWLNLCFQGLSSRAETVLRLRNGLEDGDPRTLDDTGSVFGVTRERVRQIEKKALHALNHPSARRRLRALHAFYHQAMEANAGIVLEDQLVAAVQERYELSGIDPLSFVRFTLSLCSGVAEWGEGRWALPGVSKASYRRIERQLVERLVALAQPVKASQLFSEIQPLELGNDQALGEACLRTSPQFQHTGDWVGLKSWGREKAVWVAAALSTIGRPAHFTEVALVLSQVAPQVGPMADHSVHSILLRHPGVVRTGSGTFALRRWNVQEEISTPPVRQLAADPHDEEDPIEDVMRILFPEG